MSNWKPRAIAATRGTQFGAIFCAATGTSTPAPYFAGHATVTSDNYVMADFVDRYDQAHLGAFVGSVADLIRNTEGLADYLDLTEEDRAELFAIIRKWIRTDYSGGRLLKTLEVA